MEGGKVTDCWTMHFGNNANDESTVGARFPIIVFLIFWPKIASSQCNVITIFGLKTADCNALELDNIPKTLDRDLKVLKFTDNRMTTLGVDDLQTYIYLQEMYFVRSHLEIISPKAFRGLHSLQILDLEGNKLSAVRRHHFADIFSLRMLSLKNNPIRQIESRSFENMKELEVLNLENCWIDFFDASLLYGLEKLNEINLINNELVGFDSDLERFLPRTLTVFRLWKNRWQCDCKLRWFRHWLVGSTVNWDFPRNSPSCSGPDILKGVLWKQLTPDQFACPSRIIVNSSTGVQLVVGSNASIDCVVTGDPEPTISWFKDSQTKVSDAFVSRHVEGQSREPAERRLVSSLTLWNIQLIDAGDYKCVAENTAGRSEVTFKVWIDLKRQDGGMKTGSSSSKLEVIVGAVIGGVALLIPMLAFIVCTIRRSDGRVPTDDRSKTNSDRKRNHSISKSCPDAGDDKEEEEEETDKENDKYVSSALQSLLENPKSDVDYIVDDNVTKNCSRAQKDNRMTNACSASRGEDGEMGREESGQRKMLQLQAGDSKCDDNISNSKLGYSVNRRLNKLK